jgi:Caspase domain/Domain of unknown function (DUF4384)
VTSISRLLVACAVLLTASGSWAQTPEHVGVKRAVLIGINNYRAVPSLMGSVNDVTAIREILLKRWGFQAENVSMLTDEQATRANIMAMLEKVVHESDVNDTVYIHYSGHGSQVQDLNGDEEDGLDETLVPQDGRTPGVRDIVDDELDELFSKLRTHNVVIVLDSCHSGTATRSPDIRARSVPQDMRIELYKEMPITRAIVPRIESQFIVMSATNSEQEALDGPIQGQSHGFFSYALANSLSRVGPDASPRTVFEGVAQELKRVQEQYGRVVMPEPQLEGPPSRLDQPWLGRAVKAADVMPRLVWSEVQSNSAGTLTLVNGSLLGAVPGAIWTIYPPNETKFAPGSALGVATITRLQGKDAAASLTSKVISLPAGARAVASIGSLASARVKVRILASSELRRRQVRDALAQSLPTVEFVTSDSPARFIVDADSPTLRLLTADGLQVVGEFDQGTQQWGSEAARIISRSGNASELLSLDNPAAQLRVVANVAAFLQPASRDIIKVATTLPSAFHIKGRADARGSGNSLQLAISTNEDAYITIVDVDTEGNVNLLFPNAQQRGNYLPQGLVHAGSMTLIPDSLQAVNAAGFYWDYSPPKGRDTLRIFASTDLASAEAIRTRIGSMQSSTTQAAFSELHRDLQTAATRGIRIEASGTSNSSLAPPGSPPAAADWAATTITLEVRD